MGTPLGRGYRVLLYRWHTWLYPPAKDPYAYYGYYGRGRSNRLTRAWHHLRRRISQTAPARRYRILLGRLHDWWYPPSEGGYPYYGYYGRGPRSRPAKAWHHCKRKVRDSWLGRQYTLLTGRLYFWWYPPPDISRGYYPHRPVSRPVRAMRRWLRWFRNTWLGRKMGWLLDDIADLLYFTRRRLAEDFGWRRVRRWLLRWQTGVLLGCLLAATGFGCKYGVPRYHHFLEQRYGQQAERFLAKGDFARAMLRARQILQFNVENPVATRVIADVADWFSSPFAMYWRQRTVLFAPNVTNRLALASTAMRAEAFPFPTAAKALNEIQPESRQTLAYHLVAGALAVKLSNLDEAEQHYTEAVKLAPANPASRMSLAVVRLQSKDPKVIADSRTTLELLRTDRQLGLLAQRSLVAESIGRRDFERAENLSSQVLTNAQCSFSDRILHLAVLNAARRTNFQAFLAETEQQARENFFYAGEPAA